MLDNEKKMIIFTQKLRKFKFKIIRHISNLSNLVENLKKLKKNISVYGASGKDKHYFNYEIRQ